MSGLAARQSALGTAAQVLPRLRQVLGKLQPTWHLRELATLNADFVQRHQIAALIWDVDGTLTVHHDTRLAPQARDAFLALRDLPQLGHVILSNAGEPRFRELSQIFPGIPVHKGYQIGKELVLRTRRDATDSWSEAELAHQLSAGAIPVRKPSGDLVKQVLLALKQPADRVVMVGDQYLTDIAGANLAGIRSIKLPTFARSHFPVSVQIAQRAEQLIYRLQHGAPVWEESRPTNAVAQERQ